MPALYGVLALGLAVAVAFRLTRALALLSARLGRRWGIVSVITDRSSHERPTPRLGGLALYLGFTLPAAALVAVVRWGPHGRYGFGGNLELLGGLWLAGTGMFLVGLADDFWDLPPLVKFAGQALSLAPLAGVHLYFQDMLVAPFPGLPPSVVTLALAFGWVLFFVNAFNFMDGIDGLAARFALSAALWLTLAVLFKAALLKEALGWRLEFLLLGLLAAACNGFYHVNKAPAQVFMGDGGSLWLGFALAVQVLLADGHYYVASTRGLAGFGGGIPPSTVWIILLPFIFDVGWTLLRRAHRGENLLRPHRTHLYQRLLVVGYSHREVVLLNLPYFRLCGLLGALYAGLEILWVRVLLWGAALAVMGHYARRVKFEERRGGRGGGPVPASGSG